MVVYAKNETKVDGEKAKKLITYIEENERMKPWTIVNNVDISGMTNKDIRSEILKPLFLKGVLMPTANGDIRVRHKELLQKLI
jgi:hypothetical protein